MSINGRSQTPHGRGTAGEERGADRVINAEMPMAFELRHEDGQTGTNRLAYVVSQPSDDERLMDHRTGLDSVEWRQ